MLMGFRLTNLQLTFTGLLYAWPCFLEGNAKHPESWCSALLGSVSACRSCSGSFSGQRLDDLSATQQADFNE
jgi:hypothetical protein